MNARTPYAREGAALAVVAGGGAVAIGGLTVVAPIAAVAVTGAVVVACLLALGPRLVRVFGASLVVLLAGYAFLGRGFAYVGYPPVFVGELVLLLALLTVLVQVRRLRFGIVHWLIAAFAVWGVLRTVPYLERDGINALRDAVVWGYAVFALALAVSLERRHFAWLVDLYRRLVPLYVVWVPLAAVFGLLMYGSLPRWPGSEAPVLTFKGDMGVHLAGIAAFILVGLYARGAQRPRFGETTMWPLILAGAAVTGAIIRSGLLAFAVGLAAAIAVRPATRRRVAFLVTASACLAAAAVVNPTVDLGRTQDVSLRQLTMNVISVVGKTGDESLDGNKEFRLEWWRDIVDYTVHGPYFWTGKGFGINLADDDGRTVDETHSLRAPHNTHLTVLARMGVPGMAIWIALQLAFAGSLLVACRRALRRGAVFWAGIDAWLLTYWAAMNTVTSFDPYLEGPQGGIWFWCVVGLGLAALRLQRESLDPPRREAAA